MCSYTQCNYVVVELQISILCNYLRHNRGFTFNVSYIANNEGENDSELTCYI